MIDNLKDAIAHAKEEREKVDKTLKYWESINAPLSEQVKYEIGQCKDKLTQCNQKIAWLEELQERREADTWNVIHTEADLPKEDGFYLTTVEYVESISGKLKRNTAELYFSTVFKSWSECGEDEDSDDSIIAWKPLPEPYESEDQ